ncbi:hypothetical protein FA13DRAFT_1709652 [Coprinellus micaceus]|uniref:Uncharacterized protein n=1 Tax=Coprinellus micaceus TaxID=71717 RepID=A0A4Y7TCL7_COPMI|nr:hypothetical protein FA13DRAFT_1709652 [Coprinellus micaceus]
MCPSSHNRSFKPSFHLESYPALPTSQCLVSTHNPRRSPARGIARHGSCLEASAKPRTVMKVGHETLAASGSILGAWGQTVRRPLGVMSLARLRDDMGDVEQDAGEHALNTYQSRVQRSSREVRFEDIDYRESSLARWELEVGAQRRSGRRESSVTEGNRINTILECTIPTCERWALGTPIAEPARVTLPTRVPSPCCRFRSSGEPSTSLIGLNPEWSVSLRTGIRASRTRADMLVSFKSHKQRTFVGVTSTMPLAKPCVQLSPLGSGKRRALLPKSKCRVLEAA